ncbi:metallophosphoesterase [Vibrio vulnificus]|nr:metallophosphoesterase [Vibrio vulnificus]
MNILHITDLHIDSPDGTSEALRVAFFKEYLYPLIEKLSEHDIDAIFVTGDIVNKSKFENYQHAKIVLTYLADSLNLPLSSVFICNGNHDVLQSNGDISEFENFVNFFDADKQLAFEGDYYKGFHVNDDIVIVLNSINSNYKTGCPNNSNADTLSDLVINKVSDLQPNNVYTLSHHPTETGGQQALSTLDEGEDWGKKHIWSGGDLLFRRLSKKPNIRGLAFWFSGDVHIPEHVVIDSQRVILTAASCNLVGGNTHNSSVRASVRYFSSNDINKSILFEFKLDTHSGIGLDGEWQKIEIEAITRGNPTKEAKTKLERSFSENNKIQLNNHSKLSKISIIDKTLDREINDHVHRNGLYQFGRFLKRRSLTSLSWISITQLFQEQSIYGKVIKEFRDVIKKEFDNSNFERKQCLIIGIDNWGAILSSRLGAATNLRSCGIGVKGGNESYDDVEIINENLKKIVSNKKIVFLVSDVVATGNTLNSLYQELDLVNVEYVYNLSIFLDQTRGTDFLPSFAHNYVLCGSIKTPVIDSDKLPD